MAQPQQQPVACEFFAGMGLVRLALEQTGWRVGWANDIDPLKARLYRAVFPDDAEHLDTRDVHAVDAADLPAADLWTASFPCTDLSLAGRGAGIHAGQSGAVWGMLRLLEDSPQRPRRLLFENVTGLLTSHGGRDLRALLERVNALGYGVEPLRVDAARDEDKARGAADSADGGDESHQDGRGAGGMGGGWYQLSEVAIRRSVEVTTCAMTPRNHRL